MFPTECHSRSSGRVLYCWQHRHHDREHERGQGRLPEQDGLHQKVHGVQVTSVPMLGILYNSITRYFHCQKGDRRRGDAGVAVV